MLSEIKIRRFLAQKIPIQIADEFVIPMIRHESRSFSNFEDLLQFAPISLMPWISVRILTELTWKYRSMSVKNVRNNLLADLWATTPSRVAEYKTHYLNSGYLIPPILLDLDPTSPSYALLDGNHRFKALCDLKVLEHKFLLGMHRQLSISRRIKLYLFKIFNR